MGRTFKGPIQIPKLLQNSTQVEKENDFSELESNEDCPQ